MPRILQAMSYWKQHRTAGNVTAGKATAGKAIAFIALLIWAAGCRQPEAPVYYGFQDPQIVKGAGSQTTLSTTLKLYNPNPYNLKLLHAEVAVSINGKPAGHSLLDSTIFIPQKDTFFVPVSMQVDLRSIFSNALQILMEKQVNISLDGRVRIRRGALTFNRPFHYDGKQDINALLQGSGLGF